MNFLKDIAAAIKLTGEVHRARETGATVEVRTIQTSPVYKLDYWPMTVEYVLLHGKELEAVQDVFEGFDKTTQHSLTFSPVTVGWVDRARFWQQHLRPVLRPALYHAVMMNLISGYAYYLRRTTEVPA